MQIADQHTYQRHRVAGGAKAEALLVTLLFASMGAITWAIRGTNGWGGIDGTIVPGVTWGVLWWYVCWRRGIDAGSVPLWLGVGIAIGGEWGYGQYVSWIRGISTVGGEAVAIAPWLGYAWFAVCGIAWGAPGGIVLGWLLAGRKSLAEWLTRLVVPVGCALLARIAVQTWPHVFFPHWEQGVYVPVTDAIVDPATAAATQWRMIGAWAASVLAGVIAWYAAANVGRWGVVARGVSCVAVAAVAALLMLVADWLLFPSDQLGMFAGELGDDLGRTVYTNSQNVIVVGWWLGAMLVAAVSRDRATLVAGLVIGGGFGIGFPLSAVWCLGYGFAPHLVDWWKMWELQAGAHLGLLYAAVLYWSVRQVDRDTNRTRSVDLSAFGRWSETVAMAAALFLFMYVAAREEFLVVGTLLGAFYVVALVLATTPADGVDDRRRAVTFVYGIFLLVFMLAWGASSQAGILLGLYEAQDVDQYAWPLARVALFAPVGVLIVGVALWKTSQMLRDPSRSRPAVTAAPGIAARLVDLMTLTGAVGAVTIWPAKIGVLYALLLAVALFAFNRLNRRFDLIDAKSGGRG